MIIDLKILNDWKLIISDEIERHGVSLKIINNKGIIHFIVGMKQCEAKKLGELLQEVSVNFKGIDPISIPK